MSKFERYKKKSEPYIYPHKHCKKCGEMIKETFTYCSECYEQLKQKKERKWFKRTKKEKSEEVEIKEEEAKS